MPREIAAHLQLADACERTGRIARLTEAYRAVVALAPDDPEYAYPPRQGLPAAVAAGVSAHPRRRSAVGAPQPGARAASTSPRASRSARAVAFEAAAARDPRLAEVHLALAQLAADDGRWDDAAREVALELAVQPTSREALALRARIDAARSAGRP